MKKVLIILVFLVILACVGAVGWYNYEMGPKSDDERIIAFTVEAGSTYMWNTFASRGCAIGIDQYGYSGDKEEVLSKLGFDYESIINKIKRELDNK